MRAVIALSVLLGLAWNMIAVYLMGGGIADSFKPGWLIAGALAGVAAGVFTVWSRKRRDGRESILWGLATYYLGIFVYWLAFVLIERALMCIEKGGWTDFDLPDHLKLIWLFLIFGTVWYGIILIPVAFLSRYVIWKVWRRFGV